MFAQGGSSSNTSARLDSDQSRPNSPGSKSPVNANVYGTTRAPVALGRRPSFALRATEGRREDPERRHLRVRARERRVRREPAEDDAFGTGVAQHLVGPGLQGNPVPEVERELEAVRHDADDGVHGLAEPQLASDDVSRAGEAPLPDVVADDDDGGGAGRQVGVDDDPADERRHPRNPEPGGRDLGDRHEFDRSVGRDHVAPDRLEGADIIDRLQAAAPTLDVLPRRVPPLDRPRGPRSGWRRSGRPLRAEAGST